MNCRRPLAVDLHNGTADRRNRTRILEHGQLIVGQVVFLRTSAPHIGRHLIGPAEERTMASIRWQPNSNIVPPRNRRRIAAALRRHDPLANHAMNVENSPSQPSRAAWKQNWKPGL